MNLKKLIFNIEDFIVGLIESKFLSFAIWQISNVIIIASITLAAIVSCLYSYFRYTNNETANLIEDLVLQKIASAKAIFSNLSLKFFKKILLGCFVSISTYFISMGFILTTGINPIPPKAELEIWLKYFNFKQNIIYSPIFEEIEFRAILLTFIKYCLQKIMQLICYVSKGNFTSNSREVNMAKKSDDNLNTSSEVKTSDHSSLISYTSIFASALIFSATHEVDQMPHAFFGGVINGLLFEHEDGGMVASTSEHMANNYLNYLVTKTYFRYCDS